MNKQISMHEGMNETSDYSNLKLILTIQIVYTILKLKFTPMTIHQPYHNFLYLLYQHTNVFYFFTQVPSLNLNTITPPYLPGPNKKR